MKQRVKITPQKLRAYYYLPNKSLRDAAAHFHCSPTTVKNYLLKYGFRTKTRREVLRGRTFTEDHKQKIVPFLNNYQGGKVRTYDKFD